MKKKIIKNGEYNMKLIKKFIALVLLFSTIISGLGGPVVRAEEEETESYGSGDKVL